MAGLKKPTSNLNFFSSRLFEVFINIVLNTLETNIAAHRCLNK